MGRDGSPGTLVPPAQTAPASAGAGRERNAPRTPGGARGRPAEARRKGFAWRKWNRLVHRDLGYLCAALTMVYAASGVAVNHRADWNPSYDVRRETVAFATPPAGQADPAPGSDAWAQAALEALGVSSRYRGTFRPDPGTVDIFVDGGVVSVDLEGSEATVEVVRPRPILRPANFLHLNEARRLWTWMADLYAVALFFLALTGLFVIKGKKGITGRGAWLTAIGVAIPLAFLLLYF